LRVLADHTLLCSNDRMDRSGHRKETNEMPKSTTASADTADASYQPIARASSVVPADEAASTEVLITEKEVLLSTAAAVLPRRESISRRFVASVGRIFAVSARTSRPQRSDYPKRYEFLERSLMAPEMDRL
jgi:hypothetical protein